MQGHTLQVGYPEAPNPRFNWLLENFGNLGRSKIYFADHSAGGYGPIAAALDAIAPRTQDRQIALLTVGPGLWYEELVADSAVLYDRMSRRHLPTDFSNVNQVVVDIQPGFHPLPSCFRIAGAQPPPPEALNAWVAVRPLKHPEGWSDGWEVVQPVRDHVCRTVVEQRGTNAFFGVDITDITPSRPRYDLVSVRNVIGPKQVPEEARARTLFHLAQRVRPGGYLIVNADVMEELLPRITERHFSIVHRDTAPSRWRLGLDTIERYEVLQRLPEIR
jgi:hypothetical protein